MNRLLFQRIIVTATILVVLLVAAFGPTKMVLGISTFLFIAIMGCWVVMMIVCASFIMRRPPRYANSRGEFEPPPFPFPPPPRRHASSSARPHGEGDAPRQSSMPPPKSPMHEAPVVERHHVEVLCLSGNFTFDDVKRQYRRLVKEYHPDRVAELGVKLRELAESETRKLNDAFRYFERRFEVKKGA